jgi:hypothetical protein
VLDLTTRTTEGIRNTTHLITDKPRVRPPRPFFSNRVLKEYNEDEAEGILLMNTIRKGKYVLEGKKGEKGEKERKREKEKKR